MKKVFSALSVLMRIVFIVILVYGFLCLFGEVTPWSFKNQIFLFLKGLLIMVIGVLGCTFFEGGKKF